MIFCFSGTGNSRYIANRIANVTGEEITDINSRLKIQDAGEITTGSEAVFVVPTYAWRIPKVVEQWIRNADFIVLERAWFVMTCGDEIGHASKYNQRLCEKKHWEYMGTAQIVMPENYIAMFAVPKPATAQKIIRKAEPQIDAAAQLIANRKRITEIKISVIDRIKSSIVNPVFYFMFVKDNPFKVTGDCTGCGQCAQRCPLNNISVTDGRPVWHGNCTHCMACISYCPVEAIEYGKKSIGKPRYHCDL